MKKLNSFKNKVFFFILMSFNFLFAANNVINDITTKANAEFKEAASSIAGMINTLCITLGVIWVIAFLLMMKFMPERLKENVKTLVAIIVILAIVYGLSSAYM